MRHPASERFHELLRESGEMHDRKQADYGSDSDPFANIRATQDWGISPWVGALIRLNDKVVRLKSMVRNGNLRNESAEDSMRDIAVYALIALVLYENEQHGQAQEQLFDPEPYTGPIVFGEDNLDEEEIKVGSHVRVIRSGDMHHGREGYVIEIDYDAYWPYLVAVVVNNKLKPTCWARHEIELV